MGKGYFKYVLCMHAHTNAFINQKLHGPLTRKYKRSLEGIDFSTHIACQEDWIILYFDKTKEINPKFGLLCFCKLIQNDTKSKSCLVLSLTQPKISPTSCSQ